MANDIGNAVLAGDKNGAWWMLHQDGSSEGSITFSAVGSPGVGPLAVSAGNYFASGNQGPPTGDFSFVTVCKFSSFATANDLLYKWTTTGASNCFALNIVTTTGEIDWYVNDGSFSNAAFTGTPLNTYIVIAGTYTASTKTMKLRVGTTNASTVNAGAMVTNSQPIWFGSSTHGPGTTNSYGIFFTEKVLSDADIDRIGAMASTAPTTDWLKLNGIETSGIASAPDQVKGMRREIGERAPATDGTMRVSVQALKRDLSFRTIALTGTDAFAWESFIRGEGHVWQFEDFGPYSCKGSVPQDTTGCSIVTGSAKFGSKKLRIASGQFQTDTEALQNQVGYFGDYTVMFWKSTDSGATWHHYIARSDGSKWVDGASSASSFAAFLTIGGSGDVTLTSNADFDDLVCLPFKVLDAWPAIFYARTAAYPNTPFLEATGALVPEQATRLVAGEATETVFKTVASKTNRRLDVTLTAR